MLNKFDIFYSKEFCSRDLVDINNLSKTHEFLISIEAASLEDVFSKMQAEFWSPCGEACSLIRTKGLDHTSLSVGDIVVNKNTGKKYLCRMVGWKEL